MAQTMLLLFTTLARDLTSNSKEVATRKEKNLLGCKWLFGSELADYLRALDG